jgi:phosphohistidine phosphatase
VILYFLRHGDAGAARAHDDDSRQLTAQGVAQLEAAADTWKRLDILPQVVITSPLPRARETAELLIAGVGITVQPVIDERLMPGADWGDLAQAIGAFRGAQRIMLVGHDPDLSEAVASLTGASVRLRKGGLACIEFEGVPGPGGGELVWLLDPDLYQAEPD